MAEHFNIGHDNLNLAQIEEILDGNLTLSLDDEVIKNIEKSRSYLDSKLTNSTDKVYGINTGFGALHDTSIPESDQIKLQHNLILSHACGMGDEVPESLVRLMLLLKIQNLSLGYSGVRLETVQRLIDFFNNGIYPIVYEQGSLGASGDLAPLAHLVLPLLGKGEVHYKGVKLSGEQINNEMGWKPLELVSKEGLALLNGTQFMCAYGIHILIESLKWFNNANLIASLSLDAFEGRMEPFDSLIHRVRPHEGQIKTAKVILETLNGSQIAFDTKEHVQDPYSFRCIPQVHGASYDAINVAAKVFEREMNSVTDNPTVFPDEDLIISAGNFHGQPLALQLDFLAISLSELASISERRIYKLISGQRSLPPFLVKNPGLNSGFMIAQYTAASIVSQNKQLCTPSSVDTIDSSNGQEDHVSMGANAATKGIQVLNNVKKVLAIEWFTACQAIEFRRPRATSKRLEKMITAFRNQVPFIANDEEMHPLMMQSLKFLEELD